LAIVVALLVPLMGGIVNVVISVAALTGVPLYLPVIWSLFSKRQTGRSVMTATVASLCVNAFFKFVVPPLWSFSLNRAEEMILGVGFPALLLLVFEVVALLRGREPDMSACSEKSEDAVVGSVDDEQPEKSNKADNDLSSKVIKTGIIATGSLTCILGTVASSGRIVVVTAGMLLVIVGLLIGKKRTTLSKKTEINDKRRL
jgi:hypothetical protein